MFWWLVVVWLTFNKRVSCDQGRNCDLDCRNTKFGKLESENTERDALVIEVDFLTSLVAAELRQSLASRYDGSCRYACVEVEVGHDHLQRPHSVVPIRTVNKRVSRLRAEKGRQSIAAPLKIRPSQGLQFRLIQAPFPAFGCSSEYGQQLCWLEQQL